MSKVSFRKLLKELIENTDMTQTQIGAAIGVSSATITQIKKGKVENPKYDVAIRLIDLHRRKVLSKRNAA